MKSSFQIYNLLINEINSVSYAYRSHVQLFCTNVDTNICALNVLLKLNGKCIDVRYVDLL